MLPCQGAVLDDRLSSDTYKRMSLAILVLLAMVLELRVRCAAVIALAPFDINVLLGWVGPRGQGKGAGGPAGRGRVAPHCWDSRGLGLRLPAAKRYG
jgi:hypothetical protein